MKKEKDTEVLSELSFVSIKNCSDTIMLTLLPHMGELLNVAKGYAPPHTIANAAIGRASKLTETSTTIKLEQSKTRGKSSTPTVSIKEKPLEIVLKQTPDEKTLQTLMALVGEYTPKSMSSKESEFLMEFLEQNDLYHKIKYKRSGIRIVINIPELTFRSLYQLPAVFDLFTGRQRELRSLEQNCSLSSESSQIIQVSGTGGIGKTQLVNFFARQQFEKGYYKWVVWFSVGLDEDTAESKLRTEFSNLGRSLGLDPTQMKREVLHQLIYERLSARLEDRNEGRGRGLMVIDNVSFDIIKKLLPEQYGHHNIDIIFTSRNSRMLGPRIHRIILEVLALEDAVKYIQKILIEASVKEAEKLALTLDRYALAITQALAYISDTGCSIDDFCRGYKGFNLNRKSYLSNPVFAQDPYQESRKLPHSEKNSSFFVTKSVDQPYLAKTNLNVEKNEFDQGLNNTMLGVVKLSVERIKVLCVNSEIYNYTISILMGAAYLAPDVNISKELLGAWIPDDNLDLRLNKVLGVLRTLSLLQDANKPAMVQIHQVVQDVLKINETDDSKRFRLLQWSRIIATNLKLPKPVSKIQQEERYIAFKPHAAIIAKQLRQLEDSEETLMAALTMYHITGRAEQYLGEEKGAKASFEEVVRCCDRLPNLKPALRAKYNMFLAITILTSGDPVEAEKRLNAALSIFTAESDSSATLRGICLMHLGGEKLIRGDVENACKLLAEALSILTQKLNSRHPKVLACSLNLATSLEAGGNLSKAEQIYLRILPIMEEVLGHRHVAVGHCFLGLGNIILQDDPNKALELYTSAYKILEEKLGKQHADVGRALLNLGVGCISLHFYSSASVYLRESLIILKNALGDRHVDVGRALICQHEIALQEGKYPEARNLLVFALDILQESLGSLHNEVGICTKLLSVVYELLGDEKLAEHYLKEAERVLMGKHKEIPNLNQFFYVSKSMRTVLYTTFDLGPLMTKSGELKTREENIEGLWLLKDAQYHLDRGLPDLAESYFLKAILNLKYLQSYQSKICECLTSLGKTLSKGGTSLTSLCSSSHYSSRVEVYQLIFENLKDISGFKHLEVIEHLRELNITAQRMNAVRGEAIPFKKYILYISYILTSLKDEGGLSLIEYAIVSKNQPVLELVKSVILGFFQITYQADRRDAIYFSLTNKRIDCLKLFIHCKFPLEEERKISCWEGRPRIVQQTPLQLAVQLESVESIELLVKAGADPMRRTRNYASPIDLAAGNPKLLAALRVGQQNKSDKSLEHVGYNKPLKL